MGIDDSKLNNEHRDSSASEEFVPVLPAPRKQSVLRKILAGGRVIGTVVGIVGGAAGLASAYFAFQSAQHAGDSASLQRENQAFLEQLEREKVAYKAIMRENWRLQLVSPFPINARPETVSVTPTFVSRSGTERPFTGRAVTLPTSLVQLDQETGSTTINFPDVYQIICGNRHNEEYCNDANLDILHLLVTYEMYGFSKSDLVAPV